MLSNICPSCRTGGVHNLPVLTIFYPVAGKRTGTISHAGNITNYILIDRKHRMNEARGSCNKTSAYSIDPSIYSVAESWIFQFTMDSLKCDVSDVKESE